MKHLGMAWCESFQNSGARMHYEEQSSGNKRVMWDIWAWHGVGVLQFRGDGLLSASRVQLFLSQAGVGVGVA